VEIDAFHRHHAVVEMAIRDLKDGAGLEHVPSGNFSANSAWLQCAVLAHNLLRWTATIGQPGPVDRLTVARTVRMRLIAVPQPPRQPGRHLDASGTARLARGRSGSNGASQCCASSCPQPAEEFAAVGRAADETSADNKYSHEAWPSAPTQRASARANHPVDVRPATSPMTPSPDVDRWIEV